MGGEYGNVTAADLASEIRVLFPKLQISLLVGIAAGLALLPQKNIRLGDVLVAEPFQDHAGIVTFNLGKSTPDGWFELQPLAQPGRLIRGAISTVLSEWEGLRKKPEKGQRSRFLSHYAGIKDVKHKVQKEEYPDDFSHPGREQDMGPAASNTPPEIEGEAPSMGKPVAQSVASVEGQEHLNRDEPRVWYGAIGTGGEPIKNKLRSAELRNKHNMIGLEMDAYGAMTGLQVGAIRGVSDYADEGKNKIWQPYAAAVAAAYAKTVIQRLGDLNPDSKEKGVVHHG